jgi:hypothetical protein
MSIEKEMATHEKEVLGEEAEAKKVARITTVDIVEDAPTQETPVKPSRDTGRESRGGFLGAFKKKKPISKEKPEEFEHSGTPEEFATEDVEALPKAHVVREVQTWMVGLDGSDGSEWAFNQTVNDMDKINDRLILINVTTKKLTEEKSSRDILLRHARIAEAVGVQNIELQLRFGKDTGPILCETARARGVSNLVLGHHKSKGILGPASVTKHCTSEKKVKTVRIIQDAVSLRDETLQTKKLQETGKEESTDIREGYQKYFIVNGKQYIIDVTL